ncbi:MAG: hypothetical protein K1X94_15630 [Sandaracinaceae bacterium]|nr:hypothetical protein [Sandaracinaceae bacterium]
MQRAPRHLRSTSSMRAVVGSTLVAFSVATAACDGPATGDAGVPVDAPGLDAPRMIDAALPDAPGLDAPFSDAFAPPDVFVPPGVDAPIDAFVDHCVGVVCNDPPPSTDFASCAPGATFHLPLGGACGGHCEPTTGACSYDAIEVPCPVLDSSVAAPLPQDRPWKVVLRNYLASLETADLDVPSGTLTFDASAPRSTDALFTYWLAVQSPSGQLPATPTYGGLLLPSSELTLGRIERSGGPFAMVGRESVIGGKTAWYALWDDPGNPWRGNRAVIRRAFVMAAADLMLADTYAATTACTASPRVCGDYLGGALREHASVGLSTHRMPDAVDACALAAYDLGMRADFATWVAFDYGSPNADMTMGALPGLFYVADALEDPALHAAALADAMDVLARNCFEAGYCGHQNGTYDPSYEGWTSLHLVEAALASDEPALREWVERFAALRAYSTLPEPDGRLVGPSHFAPATSEPAVRDQVDYVRFDRDMAEASIADEARYLAFAPAQEGRIELPAVADMPAAITRDLAEANMRAAATDPIPAWEIRHYPGQQAPAVRLYRAGTWSRLDALRGADATLLPVARSADYARTFGELLVSARSSGLAAIVHFGRVDRTDVGSGFGGGAISALWTSALGPVVLGWNHGSQAFDDRTISVAACSDARCLPRTCDATAHTCTERVDTTFTWADYRRWPMHHLVGERGASRISSARILDPDQTITPLGGGGVEIVTSGDLGDSSSTEAADPGDLLASGSTLSRTFHLEGGVLTVTTSLSVASPRPTLDALDESIPLFVGLRAADAITVEARVHGDASFRPLTGPSIADVDVVRVHRGTGTLEIAFDAPRAVSLGAEMAGSYGWTPRTRSLLVRVASGALPASVSFATTFRAL